MNAFSKKNKWVNLDHHTNFCKNNFPQVFNFLKRMKNFDFLLGKKWLTYPLSILFHKYTETYMHFFFILNKFKTNAYAGSIWHYTSSTIILVDAARHIWEVSIVLNPPIETGMIGGMRGWLNLTEIPMIPRGTGISSGCTPDCRTNSGRARDWN